MFPNYILFISNILILSRTSFGYPYNDFKYNNTWIGAPKYPITKCCQLEWLNITLDDDLPDNFVFGGNFQGRKFGFSRDNYSSPAFKSDKVGEKPNSEFTIDDQEIPILINPNSCVIGWYKTCAIGELSPKNYKWFFPNTGRSKYGNYVRVNGKPGFMDEQDRFFDMTSPTDGHSWIGNLSSIDMMYVECFKNIRDISTSRLISLAYDKTELEKLKKKSKKSKIISKTFDNMSPDISSTHFTYHVDKKNSVKLILDHSIDKVVETGSRTFENFEEQISELLSAAGFDISDSHLDKFWKTNTNDSTILIAENDDKFNFDQDIKIAANSSVTVNLFNNPIRGSVPFEVTFELIKIKDKTISHEMFFENLENYSRFKKIEITKDKHVLVTFGGKIVVDTGNNVNLEIVTK